MLGLAMSKRTIWNTFFRPREALHLERLHACPLQRCVSQLHSHRVEHIEYGLACGKMHRTHLHNSPWCCGQTLVEMDTGGDAFLKQVVDVYLSSAWANAISNCSATLVHRLLNQFTAALRFTVPNEVGAEHSVMLC